MQSGIFLSQTEANSKQKKLMHSLQTTLLFLKYTFKLIKNDEFQEWLESLIPEHAVWFTHFHKTLNTIDMAPLFITSLEQASCENLFSLEVFFNNPDHNAVKLFFLENRIDLEAFDYNFKTFILNKNLPRENVTKTEVRMGLNNGAGKQFPEPTVPYCPRFQTTMVSCENNSPDCHDTSAAKDKTCRHN